MSQETLLYYAQNPTNKRALEAFDVEHSESNRLCGDSMRVYLRFSEDKKTFAEFGFTGDTALVTTACASALGEAIIGENIESIFDWDQQRIEQLIESEISVRRKRASVLALLAIRNAVHIYRGDGITEDFSDVLPE